jgi:Zn-dependent protease with chaperone function
MTALIGFVLACTAAAAFAAVLLSGLVVVAYRLARSALTRCAPSTRASVAFLLGTLPAIGAAVVFVAVAAPSVGSALGLAEDHCPRHVHHLHVCFVHAAGFDPLLVALGLVAMFMLAWRARLLCAGLRGTARDLATLEAAGDTRSGAFPLILVPGGPRLCHAAGVVRRRVVVSERLWIALDARARACVLAHEEAHLRRHDPGARMLLALAGLCMPPFAARVFEREYQQGSEEACDATAAASVGAGGLVAEALVAVAGLQRWPSSPRVVASAAFGEVDLERRVRHLLAGRPSPLGGIRALWMTGVVAAVCFAVGLTSAPTVHHAVETLRSSLISVP